MNPNVQRDYMVKIVNLNVNVKMVDIVTQQQVTARVLLVSMVIPVKKPALNGCLAMFVDRNVPVRNRTLCHVKQALDNVFVNQGGTGFIVTVNVHRADGVKVAKSFVIVE